MRPQSGVWWGVVGQTTLHTLCWTCLDFVENGNHTRQGNALKVMCTAHDMTRCNIYTVHSGPCLLPPPGTDGCGGDDGGNPQTLEVHFKALCSRRWVNFSFDVLQLFCGFEDADEFFEVCRSVPVCISRGEYTHIYVYICVCVSVCLPVCLSLCLSVCKLAYLSACVCVFACVCLRALTPVSDPLCSACWGLVATSWKGLGSLNSKEWW